MTILHSYSSGRSKDEVNTNSTIYMEMTKNTHASQGYTSERGSIPMNKWKPAIPRTRVTYEQKTSVSVCPLSSVDGDIPTWWVERLVRSAWAEGWRVGLSKVAERSGAACAHTHPCLPSSTSCEFMHPDLLTELNSPLLEEFRESETVYLSFWPGHRSLCLYQLRPNVQPSTVGKSCSCWTSSPYPGRWHRLLRFPLPFKGLC